MSLVLQPYVPLSASILVFKSLKVRCKNLHFSPQFFDQDQDGCVCMADISRVLPVSSLPHVETPQIERRGRGSRRGGRGRLGESSDTLNEEVVGGEDRNMEFGKCGDIFKCLYNFHRCKKVLHNGSNFICA